MQTILIEGSIFGIMSLGVYISYKILDFPDLTVDGSFPLGAAISAVLITIGVNPWLCCLIAFFGGALAGTVTGLLHVKFGIKNLLAGILVMTALYTVNLRIAGKSNLPIFTHDTIFSLPPVSLLSLHSTVAMLITCIVLAVLMKLLLDWYLSSKSGMLLRAVGDNPQLITVMAQNAGLMKIIGLAIANALVALAGSVMCQYQRYFDITMGTGMIVMGLAAVIIGLSIFGHVSFFKGTTMVICGAIIYRAAIAIVLSLGFKPIDMKFLMAAVMVVALVLNNKLLRKE